MKTVEPESWDVETALADVRRMLARAIRETSLAPLLPELRSVLAGGRMLRARLSLRIGAAVGNSRTDDLCIACVVEMIHAASLLHDDVIDGSELRRRAPSFWAEKGVAGAILLGDLLVCRAVRIACQTESMEVVSRVVAFAGEMCEGEAYQELIARSREPDWKTCLNAARHKTGALFALAASAGVSGDDELREALSEAGYAVGTAYQLADDILDACGDPRDVGKALGNDALSGKITAFSTWQSDPIDPRDQIAGLCQSAEERLTRWPAVAKAWRAYMRCDMMPRISKFIERFPVDTDR